MFLITLDTGIVHRTGFVTLPNWQVNVRIANIDFRASLLEFKKGALFTQSNKPG